jgi:predicted RNase H-like HicB family nuclease
VGQAEVQRGVAGSRPELDSGWTESTEATISSNVSGYRVELLNLEDVGGTAKAFLVRQLLKLAELHNLTLDGLKAVTDYHVNVFYSEEDRGYIADIPDLQSCSAFGETASEALTAVQQGRRTAIRSGLETAQTWGEPIPEPSYRPVIYQLANTPEPLRRLSFMSTLFLSPPSFDGFDGGAGSRYQARREVTSYWYPTWLAQPAALVPDAKLLDCPPHNVGRDECLRIAQDYEHVIIHTSTPSLRNDCKVAEAIKASARTPGSVLWGPTRPCCPPRP